MTGLPRLGDWRPLAGPSGARLAVAGDHVAAAGLDLLSVWSGGEPVLTTTTGTPAPSRPRFIGNRGGHPAQLSWGTTVVDLAGGTVRSLDPLAAAVTPEPVPRVPGHAVGSPPADRSRLVGRRIDGAPLLPDLRPFAVALGLGDAVPVDR